MTGISALTQTLTSVSQTLTQLPPLHRVTTLFQRLSGDNAFWACALLSGSACTYGARLVYQLYRYPPHRDANLDATLDHLKKGEHQQAKTAYGLFLQSQPILADETKEAIGLALNEDRWDQAIAQITALGSLELQAIVRGRALAKAGQIQEAGGVPPAQEQLETLGPLRQ